MTFNIDNFQLMGKFVLIDVEETKESKTKSGLYIPNAKVPTTSGTVIQIGLGIDDAPFKLGDKIFFVANSIQPVAIDGESQLVKVPFDLIHGFISQEVSVNE